MIKFKGNSILKIKFLLIFVLDSYDASLVVKEGEPVYDFCWYPYMTASGADMGLLLLNCHLLCASVVVVDVKRWKFCVENCLDFQILLAVCLLVLLVIIQSISGMLLLAWYCFPSFFNNCGLLKKKKKGICSMKKDLGLIRFLPNGCVWTGKF